MTTQVQFRRGTTAEHALFTGAAGELTIDTDKNMAVIHDGNTTGGFDVFRARWEYLNTSTTLGTSLRYLVDSSAGPLTLTLPLYNNQLVPKPGDTMEFIDSNFSWDINNVTIIDPIGRKFQNTFGVISDPLVFDLKGARVQLIWDGTYWRVIVS
jgi:hypothetical protein